MVFWCLGLNMLCVVWPLGLNIYFGLFFLEASVMEVVFRGDEDGPYLVER